MIALLSDFGYKDAYIAVMKGVIATIAPNVSVCDLTQDIPPQDILAARFNLMMAYPHFPTGTVFLAVVDPGVGSARRAIALQCSNGFLVGPDNGLFGGIIAQEKLADIRAVKLTNPRYWRVSQPSATFHGRDIFAPVAAHLASGVSLEDLGDRLSTTTLTELDLLPFQASPTAAPATSIIGTGSIQYIDRFGNLITNIPGRVVPDERWQITLETPLKPRCFFGIKTYSEVPAKTLAALVGSHGWVEIACRNGSAAAMLEKTGDTLVGASLQLSRSETVS